VFKGFGVEICEFLQFVIYINLYLILA